VALPVVDASDLDVAPPPLPLVELVELPPSLELVGPLLLSAPESFVFETAGSFSLEQPASAAQPAKVAISPTRRT